MKEQVFKSLDGVTSTTGSPAITFGAVVAYDGARGSASVYVSQDTSQNAEAIEVDLQFSADGMNWLPSVAAVGLPVNTGNQVVASARADFPTAFARLVVKTNGPQTFNPITGYIVAV